MRCSRTIPQESPHGLGTAPDQLVGGEDHVDVEVLDVGEANEDAALAALLELEGVADVHDGAVDVAALHRRDLARHGAHRRDVDPFRAPACRRDVSLTSQ
jgi:hypothetical protein